MPSSKPCPKPRPGGGRCRARTCPSCGVLWAGDTRRRILANVEHYDGDVTLVSITAPGVDGVPFWWRQPDGRSWVEVPCWRAWSIPWADRENRVADPTAAAHWNSTAAARWRRLHRAAASRARRRHGVLSLLGWSWEFQKRGLLHKHVILGVNTPRERAAAQTYAEALNELRHRHGFGFVDRGRKVAGQSARHLEVIPAGRAARYVAKYLSPLDGEGKPTLSETVTRAEVPPLVVYISRTLTGETGVTMRYLRWRRHAWVLGIDPDTGELVSSMAENATLGRPEALQRWLAREAALPS